MSTTLSGGAQPLLWDAIELKDPIASMTTSARSVSGPGPGFVPFFGTPAGAAAAPPSAAARPATAGGLTEPASGRDAAGEVVEVVSFPLAAALASAAEDRCGGWWAARSSSAPSPPAPPATWRQCHRLRRSVELGLPGSEEMLPKRLREKNSFNLGYGSTFSRSCFASLESRLST